MEIKSIGNVSAGNKPIVDSGMTSQVAQNKVSEQTNVQTVKAVPQVTESEQTAVARKTAEKENVQTQAKDIRQPNTEASVRLTLSQAAKDTQKDSQGVQAQANTKTLATEKEAKAKEAKSNRQKASTPMEEAEKQAEKERTQKAVDYISESLASIRTNLDLSVDEDLGRVVVKIVDPETKEVLKQIPSEEALELAKSLGKMQGIFVKERV